jgi:hypothetical protein
MMAQLRLRHFFLVECYTATTGARERQNKEKTTSDALAIIRHNCLSVEHARCLGKGQVIGHSLEVAVVFGLVHPDGHAACLR